jgi:hypothetical protein
MIILIFAAQNLVPPEPTPYQLNGTMTQYAQCLDERFQRELVRSPPAEPPRERDGSLLMKRAITACAPERVAAVRRARQALVSVPGFESERRRASFVEEWISSYEALAVWSVTPEGDPDNW